MITESAQSAPRRSLGRSGLFVPPLGIGTNKWGSNGSSPDRFVQTFRHAVESGLSLFDTAEAYSSGQSERALGAAIAQSAHPVTVITKFAPYPTRWSAKTLLTALDASLARLGVPFVHLYLVHFPFTFLAIESLMDAMSEAHASGKIKAVGVSNYSASQTRRAAERLAKHGIPLAANEVHYSLIHPTRNEWRSGRLPRMWGGADCLLPTWIRTSQLARATEATQLHASTRAGSGHP